jgi:hypothetical protein
MLAVTAPTLSEERCSCGQWEPNGAERLTLDLAIGT